MCQLWLNLPAKFKMTAPNYQPILNQDIPLVNIPAGSVRVIAGNVLGVTGPAKVFSPVELLDVTFAPTSESKSIEIDLPMGHTVIVFVRRGGISIDSGDNNHQTLGPQAVAILGSNNENGQVGEQRATLRITATENNSSVMVLGGEPINEPIAARGPFVMNTNEELYQANQDFYAGRMGR